MSRHNKLYRKERISNEKRENIVFLIKCNKKTRKQKKGRKKDIISFWAIRYIHVSLYMIG